MFRVSFSSYPRIFNHSISEHQWLNDVLTGILQEHLSTFRCNTIDIYNLSKPYHTHNAGIPNDRFVIYFNGTFNEASHTPLSFDENVVLYNKEIPTKKLLKPNGNGLILYSPEGHAVAEFFESKWEMNILFDIFANKEFVDNGIDIFRNIIIQFFECYVDKLTKECSWLHTSNKEKLSNIFSTRLSSNIEQNIQRDKRDIDNYRDDIMNLKRQLKQRFDALLLKMKAVGASETYISDSLKNLFGDLDIIAQHEKVVDIIIDQEYIIIKTIPLKIYADNGGIYQAGAFNISINMFTSQIKFSSDVGHAGFWTDHDPHPHVNARDGYGCLGNIDSTVAELCSQMQLYPLFLILIDYLETANTEDPAGKYVKHYPLIDGSNLDDYKEEEAEEETESSSCDYCGNDFDTNDGMIVYDELSRDANGNLIYIGEMFVCPDCYNEFYTYYESLGQAINDDFDVEGFLDV